MKRTLIVLLVLSIGFLVSTTTAWASDDPFSQDLGDWRINDVYVDDDVLIQINGKTNEKLDVTKIETWMNDTKLPSQNIAYGTPDQYLIAVATLSSQSPLLNQDFKIKFKYEGHESPELTFCYYAASTMSDICTNPFKLAKEANTLEELEDGEIRLIAPLVRSSIRWQDIKLYLKPNVGNSEEITVTIAKGEDTVSALFDPGVSFFDRMYFFEFGKYKTLYFVLKGSGVFTAMPIMARWIGETTEETPEETPEEVGADVGVVAGAEVAEEGVDADLPSIPVKAVGHCSLITDATASSMGMLIILLGAMLAPLAAVRVRRKKY